MMFSKECSAMSQHDKVVVMSITMITEVGIIYDQMQQNQNLRRTNVLIIRNLFLP